VLLIVIVIVQLKKKKSQLVKSFVHFCFLLICLLKLKLESIKSKRRHLLSPAKTYPEIDTQFSSIYIK
jgi:hypothetical protein